MPEKGIDLALVKEFYTNIYDSKDGSLEQCRVRGKLIKFDEQTLNVFLETLVIIPEGESLTTFSQFMHTYPNAQTIVAKLCMSGGHFVLNVE